MHHPLAYVNDTDAERAVEILEKLEEIRATANGATTTDYAYWQGYLICYCEQNAIPDEALEQFVVAARARFAAKREP